MTELFCLERIFKIIYSNPFAIGDRGLSLGQVAHNTIQPGLEDLQEGVIHNLFEKLFPLSDHPQSKEFLSNI